MRNRLIDAVNNRSGLLLEDKSVSLALHYRQVPRLAGFAHRLAGDLVAQTRGRFKLQPGKRVVEIKPAGRDKGTAIADYMREAPFHGRLPVFLGDDATDEYGFTVVNRFGGLSVKVGPGPTRARWRLRDVAAARAWLKHGLDGAFRRRRAP
jgi:trehalose 6-phosphate phosphatase